MARRAFAAALLLVWSAGARGDEPAPPPAARCEALRANGRVLVDVVALRFLDAELQRVVQLGLAGRLTVQVRLTRRAPLWLDTELAAEQTVFALTFAPRTHEWILDGRPAPSIAELKLPRIVLRPGDSDEPAALYVDVRIELQVVTRASLADVARWISDDSGRPGAVAERVVGSIVADLTRSAGARCSVAPRR